MWHGRTHAGAHARTQVYIPGTLRDRNAVRLKSPEAQTEALTRFLGLLALTSLARLMLQVLLLYIHSRNSLGFDENDSADERNAGFEIRTSDAEHGMSLLHSHMAKFRSCTCP